MNKHITFGFIYIIICILLTSCINFSNTNKPDTSNKKYIEINCPAEIAARAYEFAKLYDATETEYELGGQDPLRAVKVDCSGLIIMCYKFTTVYLRCRR